MALAANDANDRAKQLITLSERLTGLLERETDYFIARTPQKATSFSQEKNNLARIYRNEISKISQNKELLSTANAALKDDLRAATIKFNYALEANNQATIAIKQITEGMVKSVAVEVANTRAAKCSYTANGSKKPNSSVMSAITLDQSV